MWPLQATGLQAGQACCPSWDLSSLLREHLGSGLAVPSTQDPAQAVCGGLTKDA